MKFGRRSTDKDCPERDFEWWYAHELARLPKLDRVDDLPPLSKGRCVKCRTTPARLQHQVGAHAGCPDMRMRPPNAPGLWYVNDPASSAKYRVMYERVVEASVEHQDRTCAACGFAWVEAVA